MKAFGWYVSIAIVASLSLGWVTAESDTSEVRAMVSIGDGVTSKGDYNGRTLALAQALKALPASGGRIDVLPGTYEVTTPTSISIPNVTVRGAGSACQIAVKSSTGAVDFASVESSAAGFVLENLAFAWSPGDGERALLYSHAGNLRVQDCSFNVEGSEDRNGWASCLSFVGAPPAGRDVWVIGNSFALAPWSRGLRLERMASIYVTSNRFEGRLSDPSEGVLTRDCNQQQFAANTFSSFGKRNGTKPSTGLLVDNVGGDVGHMQITGNHFHTVFGTGSCALKCVRVTYATITGNVFGRVQGVGNSAVRLTDCNATTFAGNQIENCDTAGEGGVVIVTGNATGIGITSNVFADNYVTELMISPEEGKLASGVAVMSNVLDAKAHPHETAVVLKGQKLASIAVTNNLLTGYDKDVPIAFDQAEGVIVGSNVALGHTPREDLDRLKAESARKFRTSN